MKIYVLEFDLTKLFEGVLVDSRIKRFKLGEFNHERPYIFIEADNPDDACYLGYCKLSETLLKQDESTDTAILIKEIMNDITIRKVYCKDET